MDYINGYKRDYKEDIKETAKAFARELVLRIEQDVERNMKFYERSKNNEDYNTLTNEKNNAISERLELLLDQLVKMSAKK